MTFAGFTYSVLIGTLTIVVFLLLPYVPRFVRKPLINIFYQIRYLIYAFMAVMAWSMRYEYISFTKNYPFVTIAQVKTTDELHFTLSKHYRHQRNFYISAFTFTLLFVLARISSIMKENLETQEKLENLEKSK